MMKTGSGFIGILNEKLSAAKITKIQALMQIDVLSAAERPTKRIVIFSGDTNYVPKGETRFVYAKPESKEIVHESSNAHQVWWEKILAHFAEIQQKNPTHYSSYFASSARLSRIFMTLSPWAFAQMKASAFVSGEPRDVCVGEGHK